MRKVSFLNDEEKTKLLEEAITNGETLIEEANLVNENYLIFDFVTHIEEIQTPTVEEQLAELKNKLMTADEHYNSLDKTTVSLEDLKIAKVEQLSYFCEQDILNGFISTLNSHHYRTNRDDQTNLLGKFNQLINDTSITTVMWKTEDIGYISHTREDWLSIYYEALTNKETKLFKYDGLKQTVNSKTTNIDVDAIVW